MTTIVTEIEGALPLGSGSVPVMVTVRVNTIVIAAKVGIPGYLLTDGLGKTPCRQTRQGDDHPYPQHDIAPSPSHSC
jgi:hypothetical protein